MISEPKMKGTVKLQTLEQVFYRLDRSHFFVRSFFFSAFCLMLTGYHFTEILQLVMQKPDHFYMPDWLIERVIFFSVLASILCFLMSLMFSCAYERKRLRIQNMEIKVTDMRWQCMVKSCNCLCMICLTFPIFPIALTVTDLVYSGHITQSVIYTLLFFLMTGSGMIFCSEVLNMQYGRPFNWPFVVIKKHSSKKAMKNQEILKDKPETGSVV